jgi:putative transposase
MKYAFIQQHQERFPVHRMCQVFHVSRSGYYEWCPRPESRRSKADRRLGEKIKAIYNKEPPDVWRPSHSGRAV